jgi:Family of unknown function (DUF6152)
MRWRSTLLILPALLAFAMMSYSHHSFAAVYDGTKETTIKGVVKQFRFVNPHAMMYLEATDPSGKVVKWAVEFDGRLNLSNFGWTADTIKSGEQLTVTGNPSHAEPNRMFFRKLVRADGTELVRGGQRFNSIEEDRRERARQRDQQK